MPRTQIARAAFNLSPRWRGPLAGWHASGAGCRLSGEALVSALDPLRTLPDLAIESELPTALWIGDLSTQTVRTVTHVISAASRGEPSVLPFIADLIKSLAWPVLVLVVMAMFRPEITKLLSKLAKFEGFGLKADFAEAATRLLVASSEPSIEMSQEGFKPASVSDVRSDVSQDLLVNQTPENAPAMPSEGMRDREDKVLSSWARVEAEIRRAAKDHGIPESYKAVDLISELRDADAISDRTYELLNEARSLRNKVAHGRANDLTLLASQAYAHTAGNLIVWIRSESNRKRDYG